jgi:hypothetical protein
VPVGILRGAEPRQGERPRGRSAGHARLLTRRRAVNRPADRFGDEGVRIRDRPLVLEREADDAIGGNAASLGPRRAAAQM